MFHRILFIRIENSYHDSSWTFRYKNLNSPAFYPPSFFFQSTFEKSKSTRRGVHTLPMTRWLACVSCTLAIENEALARGNGLSGLRVASFIRGNDFIGNGRGTNRAISISFFFTIVSCTNAHDTRFPIDRHESLITR